MDVFRTPAAGRGALVRPPQPLTVSGGRFNRDLHPNPSPPTLRRHTAVAWNVASGADSPRARGPVRHDTACEASVRACRQRLSSPAASRSLPERGGPGTLGRAAASQTSGQTRAAGLGSRQGGSLETVHNCPSTPPPPPPGGPSSLDPALRVCGAGPQCARAAS
jgi:hypothetical protein